ncbi:heme ABC exporter ATP-binding protein CcmA [Microbaculum marinisediminis]|uniref:Heme ABC exporter ATP-binding protein CcmA n=1 Tax=Microbaculum marinisediminis TaxID=2931392 RepID=A0AAW5QZ47_9HYPH|nr:heme ABC exporter ATP-binding protein CcmA [Microbaculum sp. A6E488]MCT8972295.1 heme ABC exporter ATP-binding protein CcmA [Microbaculum sp. A6E488]
MKLVGDDLACVRGGREVFSGLGFAVDAGELLVLRGPNGAGKSSLLRLVAGLVPVSAGRLRLDGAAEDVPVGEYAHYVGHLDALKPALTVAENLGFWAGMLGRRKADTGTALAEVGLAALADFPAGILSAGQRRRLALARLIACERPLWLLDEPTTAIDAQARARLFDLIRAHLAGGGLALVATHDALPFETRVLEMGGPAPNPARNDAGAETGADTGGDAT